MPEEGGERLTEVDWEKAIAEADAEGVKHAYIGVDDARELLALLQAAREEIRRKDKALDGLLGAIVEAPDGELALVSGSEQEVETARAALAALSDSAQAGQE